MWMVYGLIGVVASSIFILTCYEKATRIKFLKVQKIIFSVAYVFWGAFVAAFIPSFLSILFALGFISGILFLFKKSLKFSIIFLILAFNQATFTLTAGITGFISWNLVAFDIGRMAYFFALSFEIGIYILTIRSKFVVNLWYLLKAEDTKLTVLLQSFLLLFIVIAQRELWGFLAHLLEPTIFWLLFLIMSLLLFMLVINLKSLIKKEIDREQLKEQVDDLTSLTHSYKNSVRLTTFLLQELNLHMAEDGSVADFGNVSDLTELISNFENLMTNLDSEVIHEEMARYVKMLDIPNEWWGVKLTLGSFAWQAHNQGVFFEVKNKLDDWSKLKVSMTELSQLVENLVSNALKELVQTKIEGKLLLVRFVQDEVGHLALEVRDNAHEFSLDVLSKLGQRKNSTNGTGDGYAEIFDILNQTKASFLIEEVSALEHHHKKVIVTFDRRRRVEVRSNYRQKEINDMLKATDANR